MLLWVVLNFLFTVLIRHCTAVGHFENVALGKSCGQSSYFRNNQHWCSAAINGDTSGIYNTGPNCIHTDTHDWTPYWQVDLGQSYPIHHIVVWGRTEGDTITRMSGCKITVDGDLCYTFGNVSASHSQRFDITCSPPLSGQVISIYKNATGTWWRDEYSINMCEFQVYAKFVCDDGYWGSECDTACGRCSSGQSCDKQTGDCPAGCAVGFFPPKCTERFVNGNWGSWTDYDACSQFCGGGSQSRSRQCDHPAPAHGGVYCSGSNMETGTCDTLLCPVNGQWGPWGGYGPCSVTCGGGSQTRSRQCDHPAPAHGGAACPGASTETIECNPQSCPVNGQWGSWGPYSACSQSCGGGSQTRSRQCDHPAPANNGAACPDNGTETRACSASVCPVDGQWGPWQSWGTCSVTCGGGSQSRSRQCDHPAPAHNGAYCPGNGTESQDCNALLCQVPDSEFLTAVSAAVIGGAAVGGALVTAAIGAVIFFVRRGVRRNGRDTPINGGRGTRKTTRRNLPHTRLSTDTVYEDVTDLGAVDVAGAGASPTSPAATSRTTDVYENVGNSSYEAPSNYETLDLSTLGQRSVYTVMKTYKK